MSYAATYKLSTRLFWLDKTTLFVGVLLPVGLAVGMPALMRRVQPDGVAGATAVFQSSIAFLLAITAFLNVVVALTSRRDQLVLKRLRAGELTDAQILLGQISSTATQTLAVIAVCTVAVRFAAGVPLPENPLVFAAFSVAGSAVLALLGAAFTPLIPRAELAAIYAMPVFMGAGVGAGAMGPIPLPSWLQAVLDLMPTTAVVNAIKHGDVAMPALNLAVWALIGIVAIRLWFRWEPRRS
ncbi:ABC transporter permease [Nonomuraea sp. NN258]|uniref:ABC transporter permease n=1 Tax=Nonomuraea antri TaxID=2730852 RepID=UPI00156A60FA|nr:ABC transporter permease [Nonomuraea antri]NRQ40253.1 ABC transporter permease [Nonomuraea antri]